MNYKPLLDQLNEYYNIGFDRIIWCVLHIIEMNLCLYYIICMLAGFGFVFIIGNDLSELVDKEKKT